ncbi:MAG TPA: GMC family oxidoreductase [Gemmatimonadaceae bacterium]|nr:GMC family oxidoreductase [Gemmatimonadaceae bacterium]
MSSSLRLSYARRSVFGAGLKYDVIVIGSGFGGAVTACRLAERGMRVLVLERGRRWAPEEYPRHPGDAWFWSQRRPQRANGWIDFRIWDSMSVAQGAGVGGGSLIYANIVVDARPEVFEKGWPAEITHGELRQYYDRVARMMNVQQVPENQRPHRFRLMQEAAEKAGHKARFRPLPLGVTFDPEWSYDRPDAFGEHQSKKWVNDQGVEQGTCVHCGHCDLGCRVRAKNTLDVNYIPWAERHGAEVRPLHQVERITPRAYGKGFRVDFRRYDGGRPHVAYEEADRVIVAAGSLGSTELLLRCRDQYQTMPRLSPALGYNWSSNGDFLTPAVYTDREVEPSQGPTITCAIDFLDGTHGDQRFFIEDGGFPDLLGMAMESEKRGGKRDRRFDLMIAAMKQVVRVSNDPCHKIMPWFAQGVDAGDGRLYLGRPRFAPWRRELMLDWRIGRSQGVIDAIVAMHTQLSEVTGGTARIPPSWSLLKSLVTPHPLGGCNMADTPDRGVVDHRGQVFNYPGLYVADGAIVPRAIGINPSKTIAALAERTAEMMV